MGRDYLSRKKTTSVSNKQKKKKEAELIFPGVNDGSQQKKLSHRQKQRLMKRQITKESQQDKKRIKLSQKEEETENVQNGGIDSDIDADYAEEELVPRKQTKPTKRTKSTNGSSKSSKKGLKEEKEESPIKKQPAKAEDSDSDASYEDLGESDNKDAYLFESDEDELEEENGDEDEESDGEDESSDDEDEDSDGESSGWSEAEKECDELMSDQETEEVEGEQDDDDEVPSLKDVLEEVKTTPNIKISIARVETVINILDDFRTRRSSNKKRSDYLAILKADLCLVFSYNEFLMGKLMDLFPPKQLMEFLDSNESDRPVTIRTNTLKTRRKMLNAALNARGVRVEVLSWTKVGLVVYGVPTNMPLGATPEYLAGHYLLQGSSSLLPVMALAPKENESVLDMCAAPGGKSTHIGSMMKNTGTLYCNDVQLPRMRALVANLHRMGVTNAVVTCLDGRKIAKKLRASLDRVLLDAPCTGTGIICKDERVKMQKTSLDVQRCSHLQFELLKSAVDAVSAHSTTGGYVVYSTCSILIEENEQVIDKILRRRDVKLVPTGIEIGDQGFTSYKTHRFHPSLNLLKRVYPHKHNMEGFCVAKLKVLSNHQPKKQPKE